MILVNRNFGNPVLAGVIGDMFKGSTNEGQNVDWVPTTGTVVSGSSLVAGLSNLVINGGNDGGDGLSPSYLIDKYITPFNTYNVNCQNFYIVTEHFLKTLDKVYTKIWNESFTETGLYTPSNLAPLYSGFVSDTSGGAAGPFMMFKKFVDRCITAGIFDEEDRLQYEDQIFLSGMVRTNMSTQIDLANKLITMTHSTPIDISPDINAQTGQYLNGKKLFLMMTPYLTNESVDKNSSLVYQEPISNYIKIVADLDKTNGATNYSTLINTPIKRPIAFFKPKTDASKFGRSLPLATHFFWSIGTPADKEVALLEGKPVPDLIFDHLDRISHIDSLTLKIKFDKLSF